MLSGIHSHCGCPYARVNHDGIYRAIDTYLKAHPNLTKQERKQLCRLIDTQKFSPEATLHATHNDRLPVRTVLQLLFSEQTKLTNQLRQHVCHCTRPGAQTAGTSFNAASSSTRQLAGLMASETIQKLNDDLLRVQTHCDTMQRQMENLLTINQSVVSTMTNKKKADSRNNKSGFFGKYVGMIPSFRNYNNGIDGTVEIDYNVYYGGVDDNRIVNDPKGLFGSFMGSSRRRRPCASMDVTKDLIHKARVVSKSWRHSSS